MGSHRRKKSNLNQISETPKGEISSILAGWASTSPEAALAYYDDLEKKGRISQDLKLGLFAGLVKASVAELKSGHGSASFSSGHFDPSHAVRFVTALQEACSYEVASFMDLITQRVLLSREPAAAANWASTLPLKIYASLRA